MSNPMAERGSINHIFSVAEQVIANLLTLPSLSEQSKRGGVLVVAKTGFTNHIEYKTFGSGTESQHDFAIAASTVTLLLANPGMISSFANSLSMLPAKIGDYHKIGDIPILHNELNPKYGDPIPGGAFRFGKHVLGFAGFPVEDNESTILTIGVQANLVGLKSAHTIAQKACCSRFEQIYPQLIR